MTNQDRRGIGQRDWLADSQQRLRRWLPAPVMSLRRPGVVARPTLGNVMQRRATRTIEGIPLGPVAGRRELPLVLRRPIKTSIAPEPLLTLHSPTQFEVEESVDAVPVTVEGDADGSPPLADAPLPAPATTVAAPAGGLVTRVFRRLFNNPQPPALEGPDEQATAAETPAAEGTRPPPVAEEAPAPVAPAPAAAIPRDAAVERPAVPDGSAALPPVGGSTPTRAGEAPVASPPSLITRLLRRREPEANPLSDPQPEASGGELAAVEPPDEVAVESLRVESPAAGPAIPADPPGIAERTPAAATPAEASLTLRHAPRLDPDAKTASTLEQPLVTLEEPPAEPATRRPAPEVTPPVAPVASAESASVSPIVASRSAAPSLGSVAVPASPPGFLLRLRRLIRAEAPDGEAAPSDASADSTPMSDPVATVSPSYVAPASARSIEPPGAAEESPVRDATSPPLPASGPLVVRARRQAADAAGVTSERVAYAEGAAESATLQLQPWAPVFRARSQTAETQSGTTRASPPGTNGNSPVMRQVVSEANGNLTLSAPADLLAPAALEQAAPPTESREDAAAAAPEDPAKAGAALDQLASQIYERLRRRLVIERERAGGLGSQWQ